MRQSPSPNPDRLLNTVEASRYLLALHGISYTPGTLTQFRYRECEGPEWVRIGKRGVGYYPFSLDRWARTIISKPQAHRAA
ncbi:MAG: hypothetical protein ACR652_01275 [Methylocystis sp.]|uniref:hypothetical protein n=1 Tax=Methylocystis sp. TaxID=1911079 RepID=UPI003DA3A48E